jgi:hypothetical protein
MDCLLLAARNATAVHKALPIFNATAAVVCAPVNQVLGETNVMSVCLDFTT